MDQETRNFFEPRFGHDFSHVRVHTDAQAAESAWVAHALAYTAGRDIVFGRGQYAPTTRDGQRLLAHELTHVVQQGQSLGGTAPHEAAHSGGAASSSPERQANDVAARVLSGSNAALAVNGPVPRIQLQQAPASGGASHTAGIGPAATRIITAINVNMNNPQNVTLDWSDGSHTTGIECSTGQGHCCPRPCDPPANAVDGSNCTPDGAFTVDNKYRVTSGLNYFVSFVPSRSIGLHEYAPVNGTPLSHGCVRLHTADARTVYNGSVPGTTTVNVSGLAIPNCPRPGVPTCPGVTGGSTGAVTGGSSGALAETVTHKTTEIDPAIV